MGIQQTKQQKIVIQHKTTQNTEKKRKILKAIKFSIIKMEK